MWCTIYKIYFHTTSYCHYVTVLRRSHQWFNSDPSILCIQSFADRLRLVKTRTPDQKTWKHRQKKSKQICPYPSQPKLQQTITVCLQVQHCHQWGQGFLNILMILCVLYFSYVSHNSHTQKGAKRGKRNPRLSKTKDIKRKTKLFA